MYFQKFILLHDYISANTITFEGIDKVVEMLNKRGKKGIFVNDRGYDSNEILGTILISNNIL